MTVVARGTRPYPADRDGYELAVPGMEQAAAQARRLSDEVAWESHADRSPGWWRALSGSRAAPV